MFTVDDYLPRRFDMKSYNCWHLAKDVWCDLTNERLESRDIGNFVRLESPSTPCFVLMQKPSTVPHVGIYYEGMVLHMHPVRGTCYEKSYIAALGFPQTDYYVTKAYENRSHR